MFPRAGASMAILFLYVYVCLFSSCACVYVSEYYEASESCRELAYIRGILEDFYGEPLPPTPLYINNAACISMGNLPVFSERQKHIPIRVAHLKECTAERMVELKPVNTKFELADIGTKALPSPAFVMLCDVILGKVSFSSVQGF